MNKKRLLLSAIGLALASGLPINVAFAQEAQEATVFEEVIVTATKREQSIYDVPVAVSAFTASTIEKQGITDLTDIGKFVPNLNVTGFSAGHTSSVNAFIRGIGLQDHLITTDPGVGVYVDGVYLGRQVGQNWSLANIERVEVLRGPQGTLYGRNSIGGAINIITKQPGDENGGQFRATVGTRGRLNGDVYYDAPLGDSFAISFTGSYVSRDGLGDFVNVDTSTEVGEMSEWSGRVAAKWEPNDRFSLLFAYDKSDGEGGLRPYTTFIDEVPNGYLYQNGYRNSDVSADPYDNNTGQVNQVDISNKADGYAFTADFAITDNLDAKLIYSDRSSEYASGLDDDSLYDDVMSFPEVGWADQTSIELQINGQYGAFDFVTGLYFFEEEGENFQHRTVFQGPPDDDHPFALGDFRLGQKMDSQAIYANLGYQVSDRLRLSGGMRYTEDDKTASININSSLIEDTKQRDWDEVSWEIAASYEMNDRLNVYGTIQNGYQSGQFPPRPFCLFGFLDFTQPGNVSQPNCFEANENVTATNYEVGLKGTPLDTLQMSIAVFYTDYSDLPYQVSTTEGAGFNTVNIIVDQTSKGVEWESTWAPTQSFALYTTLGYIDADVKDPNPAAVAPLTPKWTASISPEYTMVMGNGAELVFRGDWSYRDKMWGEPSNDPGRLTQIDSRTLINVDVAYHSASGRWTLAAYGRNVTDERYDNARLNLGDYILAILSNDASEFGLRFVTTFGQ
jgi:iron complex outermembrane receptor protein